MQLLLSDHDMSDARSWRGSRFAGDLQRAANERESPGTETTLVPLLRRPSILVCFNTPYLPHARVPLRATLPLYSEYTHPRPSLGSTSNLPRDIYASQNVLPEEVVQTDTRFTTEIYSISRARPRT